jgi:DNA-binding transcriptional LysR family regulator
MVAIRSSDADSINSWLSSGLCDLGLAMFSGEAKGVRSQVICRVDCVAILPPAHPLAAHDALEPAYFDGQPYGASPRGSALRGRIDALLAAASARPAITAEASLGASICSLVSAGLGVSIMNPLAAAEERDLDGLVIRPFRPALSLDVVLLFPEHQVAPRLVEAFSECAARVIKTEIDALQVRLWQPDTKTVSAADMAAAEIGARFG